MHLYMMQRCMVATHAATIGDGWDLARHLHDGYGCLAMAPQHPPSRMTLTLLLEAGPHRVEHDAENGRFFAINDDLHTIAALAEHRTVAVA